MFSDVLEASAKRLVNVFGSHPSCHEGVAQKIVAEGETLRQQVDLQSGSLASEDAAWLRREVDEVIRVLGQAGAYDEFLSLSCVGRSRDLFWSLNAAQAATPMSGMCAWLARGLRTASRNWLLDELVYSQESIDIHNFVIDIENAYPDWTNWLREWKNGLNKRVSDNWDLLNALGEGKKPVMSDFQGIPLKRHAQLFEFGIYLESLADTYARSE